MMLDSEFQVAVMIEIFIVLPRSPGVPWARIL